MHDPDREFVYQLTACQSRLYGYLTSLLGNLHDARDVLQETNFALWKKMGTIEPGTDFEAWARRFAYYQALAFLRDRKRDRHVFDGELVDVLAHDEIDLGHDTERELALRDCLTQLPARQRELIQFRYEEGACIADVVKKTGKNESAVKVMLLRIRKALLACIKSKMEATPNAI